MLPGLRDLLFHRSRASLYTASAEVFYIAVDRSVQRTFAVLMLTALVVTHYVNKESFKGHYE